MTLHQFTTLNEFEQHNAVLDGVHIGDRPRGRYWILLYQLDSFYVEVFYDARKDAIVGFRPFRSVGQLSPYLKQIDISELITYSLLIFFAYPKAQIAVG